MTQEQGTDVGAVQDAQPVHVLHVTFPGSSFVTSKEAEVAVSHALTDMAKALGVLGPQVAMQDRSNATDPGGPLPDGTVYLGAVLDGVPDRGMVENNVADALSVPVDQVDTCRVTAPKRYDDADVKAHL